MKNLYPVALVLFLGVFSSCTRTYKCMCVFPPGTQKEESGIIEVSGVNMKKNAERGCSDTEQDFISRGTVAECEIE